MEISRGISPTFLSPLRRWFDRARQFIRELIHAASTALRGQELDAVEAEQADKLADAQDDYTAKFQAEMEANPPRELAEPAQIPMPAMTGAKPPMSPAQFGARAEMYADSAWQGAQRIERTAKARIGTTRWERLIMGRPKTEHCGQCPPDAALGWVPFGTLKPIGDRECENLCLCHFEYSDQVEQPTAKVPKGKPPVIEITKDDDVNAIAQKIYDRLKQGLKVKVVVGVGTPRG